MDKDKLNSYKLFLDEIASIAIRMNATILFDKLLPLFKNRNNVGSPSFSAVNMNKIEDRIKHNINYASSLLEFLINEVEIPERKEVRT